MKALPPSFTHPGHTPGVISSACVEKGMLWNSGWKFSFSQMKKKKKCFKKKEEMFLQEGGLGLAGHCANSPAWTF